jgi:catechol 2,3-dioxygenase-like lactoylglutathione lyase family enzyme
VTLHHLALGATDVERVAGFYMQVLRLREQKRSSYPDGRLRAIWLGLNPGLLMVEHTIAPPREIDGVGFGPFLIAIGWPEGLTHAVKQLDQYGITIESRSEFTLYFRDPEANRVAISVYPLK